MIDLFGNIIPDQKVKLKPFEKGNPCIRVYGAGPEGKRCKHCAHLYVKTYSNRYFKCDLRKNTNGPATDHKMNWAACAKFELIKPPE